MSWGNQAYLLVLPVLAVLTAMIVVAAISHYGRLKILFPGDYFSRVVPRSVRVRRWARDILAMIGLALLAVALAEPLLGKQIRQVEAKGVDIVMVVDLSRSMDCTDVKPTRLEHARREMIDLLSLLEGDRIGLVIYAAGAYPRMPLSHDYRAMQMLVGELDTTMFQAQGSALGEAIRTATDLLSNRPSEAGRAIVVLSDGEVHDIDDALKAAREAASDGIVVYGLGVGSEPSPIPLADGTLMRDQDGTVIMSRPTGDVLADVARITGGAYVQSVAGLDDVSQLYGTEIRGRLRAVTRSKHEREEHTSIYQLPLGVGVGFLLIGSWLGDGRRRWWLQLFLVFGLASASPMARATTLSDADSLYRDGDFIGAERAFNELTVQDPMDPDLFRRLAASRYRSGDFEGATAAWDRAVDLGSQVNDAFNAANAQYLGGHLGEAQRRYRAIVEALPEHEPAKKNLALVTEEIQQRLLQMQQEPEKRPQPEPQPQDQQSDSESDESDPREGEPEPSTSPPQPATDPSSSQAQSQAENSEEDGAPQSSEDPSEPGESKSESDSEDRGGDRKEDRESEVADLEEVLDSEGAEDGDPASIQEESEQIEGDGTMTASQADRMLEGVKEGRPRVYIPGGHSDKPW